ncbi:protein of unknown function [Vibrio tapetis subsp. tapetis]|uniref:Uncharacterized protein n=1 Tax=Vibrio tapetis subsp. tapetis TaxID=1671868 RepID=A0A2N8ZF83_9VIBR|nr:protein of unknown function [Vibrio tapetis subsp. tapetis]
MTKNTIIIHKINTKADTFTSYREKSSVICHENDLHDQSFSDK